MSMNELQKQTNANIQAKANLIWEIATHLVGLFKPHEYGKVILPMTVLKRFDDALKPTKAAVVEMAKKLDAQHIEGAARDGILCRISGFDFYNISNYDFAKLIADPDNVEINFEAYAVEMEHGDGCTYITQITSLQIVNGGQTTASLAAAIINDKDRANGLRDIYVPMKLSVVTPEKAMELIPNIARFLFW